MADIDVQRKEGSIWPWILGLLVAALLVWGIVEMVGDDDLDDETVATVPAEGVALPTAETAPGQTDAELANLPQPLQSYIRECTAMAGSEPADMGKEHEFTATCLEQLGNAIRGVATGSTEALQTHMSEYDSAVQSLRSSDASSTQHANMVRTATTQAEQAISALQQAKGVTADGTTLQNAATEVGKQTQLLEQTKAVKNFFREAATALRNIAQQPAA